MKTIKKILIGAGILAIATFGVTKIASAYSPAQNCPGNQFFNNLTQGGTFNCGTASSTSINGGTSLSQTIVGGTATSVTTATSSSNTTTTINNIGVTSFTGAGCVTAANSTGSVALAVSCISGNQNILFTISGDATGTASGTTAISDSITVVGLNGKVLPANTTGTLQYSQGAWAINLATSSLGVYDANGKLSSYVGSTCGGGQYVTGFSATGTVACGTPASGTGTVGTSTAPTAGYFATWGSATALNGTSTVQQSSTQTLVGANATSDWFQNVNTAGSVLGEFDDYLNATTTLASGAASTSIQISTTTGLAPTGLVVVNGAEILSYQSFTNAGTSSTLNNIHRALFGTSAQVNINSTVRALAYIIGQNSSTQPEFAVACDTLTDCFASFRGIPSLSNGGVMLGTSVLFTGAATHNATDTIAANLILASTTCTGANNFYDSSSSVAGQVQCAAVSFPASPATTTINSFQSATFNVNGTGNVTSTSGSNGTTTFSLTGVIPAVNGGTATTTALGTCAFLNTCGSAGVATTTIVAGGNTIQAATFTFVYAATSSDNSIMSTGTTITWNQLASSTWAKVANNLNDLQSSSTAATNLGLGVGSSPTFANVTVTTNVTTTNLYAMNIYDSGATTTQCESDPSGLIAPGPCVTTFNGNSGAVNFSVVATGSATTTTATSGGNSTTTINVPMATQYTISTNYPSAGATFTANQNKCWGYPVFQQVQFNWMHYVSWVGDASTTDHYDQGIYLVSSTAPTLMTLIADYGASSFTGNGTIHNVTTTQGMVTLLPSNTYWECITGVSSTAQFTYSTSIWDFGNNTTGSASVGGQLPATSSVPATSWGSAAVPSLYLSQF